MGRFLFQKRKEFFFLGDLISKPAASNLFYPWAYREYLLYNEEHMGQKKRTKWLGVTFKEICTIYTNFLKLCC